MVNKDEVLGFAEVGAYQHKNDGKTTIKMYATTNKSIKPDAAVLTERIAHRRYELHEIEDASVNKDVVYQKDVWSEQHDKGNRNVSGSAASSSQSDTDNESSPLLVEKFREQQDQLNNHDTRITGHDSNFMAITIAIIGVVVLVAGALIAIAIR